MKLEGVIFKSGVQRCILVPDEVANALGGGPRIPVLARIGEIEFQSTLMPVADGGFKLFINGDVRRALAVDVGDHVVVALKADPDQGETTVPHDLGEAVDDFGLSTLFWALTPRQRREMVTFVERAKSPSTRAKYIARVIEVLEKRTSR